MRISRAILALALSIPNFVAAQPVTETPMPPITYPETTQMPVTEEHFGHTITDPYRWLENDVRSDVEVARWVEAQNAVTED